MKCRLHAPTGRAVRLAVTVFQPQDGAIRATRLSLAVFIMKLARPALACRANTRTHTRALTKKAHDDSELICLDSRCAGDFSRSEILFSAVLDGLTLLFTTYCDIVSRHFSEWKRTTLCVYIKSCVKLLLRERQFEIGQRARESSPARGQKLRG